MTRKIINISLFVLLLGGISFLGYRFFTRVTSPEVNVIDAIPESSALVVYFEQPFTLWKNLESSNLMWDDLKQDDLLRGFYFKLIKIDSLANQQPAFGQLLFNKEIALSLHPIGSNQTEMMLVCKQGSQSEEDVLKAIESVISNTKITHRVFKNDNIYQLPLDKNYFLIIKNGYIALCSSAELCESVAMHIESKKSIRHLAGFSNVELTVSKNSDASIYINHNTFTSLLTSISNSDIKSALNQISPYANFSGLDVALSSGTISLNGFTFSNDSSALITVFNNQAPQEFEASKILPENTSGFLWLGINDGESFHANLENYYAKRKLLQAHQEKINQINSDFDCNIRQSILSWIGNEIVLFSTASPHSEELSDHYFLAIKINELNAPINELNALAKKLDSSTANYALMQHSIDVGQLAHDELFSSLFGSLFSVIKHPYYLRIDNYVIFANHLISLENYIRDIAADKSLGKNITYFNFVSENLSKTANLTVYANPSQFNTQLQHFLNEKQSANFESFSRICGKFNGFAWQMIQNGKNLYYNNLYLKYNPTGKQDSKSLWEFTLDTSMQMKPQFVHNHITNTKDVVVQDLNYMIYLINNKGQLLWKKQLDEKLIGDIRQIDYYGNGKLQLAFCTQSQLHLIDLKGNYMKNFPINLNKEVTSSPAIFDYENNSNYRILIPVGKQLLNLDKDGKKIDGWDFAGMKATIKETPIFFRCGNKDYIFVVDQQGHIAILDRKGNSRFDVNQQLKKRSTNVVVLKAGQSIENSKITFSDSLGRIIRFYFNGSSDTAKIPKLSATHRFVLADINKDQEDDLILLDSNRIQIYYWNGMKVAAYDYLEPINFDINAFKLKDGSYYFGTYSGVYGQLYLHKSNANLHPRFPLNGTTPFMLSDMNGDGSYELVSGTGSKRVVCYSFN